MLKSRIKKKIGDSEKVQFQEINITQKQKENSF